MSKVVVLAEKPSVGRDIARVLGCQKKGNGFFEGDRYIVTWALGHLVTHADPEAYDAKYKSWRLEDLPMLPAPLKLVVIKQSGSQFHVVKTQLNRNDVKKVVIATDAGREGELVARWILEKARVKKPIQRLWISSVTDKAIREGFRNLKDGKTYEPLFSSAVARAEADWYVGLNATRALTSKFNAQLSCGRVQTPTLAMIAQRDEERKAFRPKSYYGMKATTKPQLSWTWYDQKTNERQSFQKERIDALLREVRGKDAEIINVEKKEKKSFAPALYDLTELQREANHRFGYSAKETLSIMQRLYEQHKVLTYPRTDSRYLSSDIVDTLKDRLAACQAGPYAKLVTKMLKQPIKVGKAVVDDSKVSDHHAIIPTEQTATLHTLSDKERKIYDLVVRRFLAVLLPPMEYEQTTATAKIGGELFMAKGKRVLKEGWKEAYERADERDEDEQELPELKVGAKLSVTTLVQTSGETQPPTLFNEGTLLSAMENPSRFLGEDEKDLAKTLGRAGGIGTVATRADIIEKLFKSFLIEKNGTNIIITSKGKQLLELVPEELKSPALTAEWEQKLEQIAKGALSKQSFVKEIMDYTKSLVSDIKASGKTFKHQNVTGSPCPECGKLLLEVNGKKGKMRVCQDRECGFRRNVSRITNAHCPKCKKKLELRGEGEGQIFACVCGYREKKATFEERRKQNKHKNVSKREVSQYLKKQDDDKGLSNPALAEALAKLNLDK